MGLAALLLTTASAALGAGESPSREVARGAAARLELSYVFPDRGTEAARILRQDADAGAYDDLQTTALAERLTSDLAAVLHDKHVRVRYTDGPGPPPGTPPGAAAPPRQMMYGLARVAHLEGNIGYVDLRGFVRATPNDDRVIDAALDAVASSGAIILDLRKNGGGDPEMVARLLSHLVPPNTHLNDFLDRTGAIQQTTSTVALPGAPIRVPLYALTSAYTFSGGEECAYDLKALKRATLVGETTGGGTNPGGTQRIDDHFSIFVPDARPRNAITQTNWEGTGVKPDVAVPADHALTTAYALALNATHAAPAIRAHVDAVADVDIPTALGTPVAIVPDLKMAAVAPAILARYVGTYQNAETGDVFVITVDGDHLETKLNAQRPIPMLPESPARFFANFVNAEMEFFTDPATHAITHLSLYQGGREQIFKRSNPAN